MLVDSTEYIFNCAEQAMMVHKAHLFNDGESIKKIMQTSDPKKQKEFGRRVVGFTESVWDANKIEIMNNILFNKFNQSDLLANVLTQTNNKTIVEASPYDKIWGVGLHVNDQRILYKNNWLGQNLLGICLMNTRDRLNQIDM